MNESLLGKTYVSLSGGMYYVIDQGMPISPPKCTEREAVASVARFKNIGLRLSDFLWNGDAGKVERREGMTTQLGPVCWNNRRITVTKFKEWTVANTVRSINGVGKDWNLGIRARSRGGVIFVSYKGATKTLESELVFEV